MPFKISKLNIHSSIQRNKDISFNMVDDEVVMFALQHNKFYGMNKIGSHIWELLENPISFNEIIENLQNEYSVTKEACVKDTVAFLDKLNSSHLLNTLEPE